MLAPPVDPFTGMNIGSLTIGHNASVAYTSPSYGHEIIVSFYQERVDKRGATPSSYFIPYSSTWVIVSDENGTIISSNNFIANQISTATSTYFYNSNSYFHIKAAIKHPHNNDRIIFTGAISGDTTTFTQQIIVGEYDVVAQTVTNVVAEPIQNSSGHALVDLTNLTGITQIGIAGFSESFFKFNNKMLYLNYDYSSQSIVDIYSYENYPVVPTDILIDDVNNNGELIISGMANRFSFATYYCDSINFSDSITLNLISINPLNGNFSNNKAYSMPHLYSSDSSFNQVDDFEPNYRNFHLLSLPQRGSFIGVTDIVLHRYADTSYKTIAWMEIDSNLNITSNYALSEPYLIKNFSLLLPNIVRMPQNSYAISAVSVDSLGVLAREHGVGYILNSAFSPFANTQYIRNHNDPASGILNGNSYFTSNSLTSNNDIAYFNNGSSSTPLSSSPQQDVYAFGSNLFNPSVNPICSEEFSLVYHQICIKEIYMYPNDTLIIPQNNEVILDQNQIEGELYRCDIGPSPYSIKPITINEGISQFESSIMAWTVYPNPANDFFEISTEEVNAGKDFSYNLELLDLSGRVILSRVNLYLSREKIELGDIPSGAYLIKITDNIEGTIQMKKLIKY
tara:strand:- start:640 stop:2508 length:1869 start_codon:yes stop_codon:yes gene_type:complete